MKITSIKPYFFNPGVAKNLLFCRVETDEGIYGWGEAYVVQRKEKVVEAYIEGIKPYLIGRSPFNIKHIGQALFNDFCIRRGSSDFFSAWSAIEIALWDIVGKYTGLPIYNLMGGASRERIRVYANGWWQNIETPEQAAQSALSVKEMGYTAMQWDPFKGPWRSIITKKQEDFAVECVKAVREAVGSEVDLLIEVHRRLSPYHAAHFADRIAKYNPFWIEEPCLADNIDLVVEAKKRIGLPIVTGETKYTKSEFRDVFEKYAADIINPDVCACNGIQGMLETAAMAEPYSILLSPHNYNSTAIGLAATIHVSAVATNFLIAKIFLNFKEACDEIVANPLRIDNGFIDLPTDPGLGIDLDMDVLQRHPYKELKKVFPVKGVAQYYEEFPRKEDFNAEV